jgi:hypothetical protein
MGVKRLAVGVCLAVMGVGLLPVSAGARAAGDPTITLLTPAQGSPVSSAAWLHTYPAFTWRIDWPDVASSIQSSTVLVTVTTATDQWFTQNVTQENNMCPVQNLNCWSYSPQVVWGMKPDTTWYWRVGVDTSHGFVYSQTASFIAKPPSDQTAPRVQAMAGKGKRGATADVDVRAADAPYNQVRFRIAITGHGHTLFDGPSDFLNVGWGHLTHLSTNTPLPTSAPPGRYRVCITAWDHVGNKSAPSCAAYTVS